MVSFVNPSMLVSTASDEYVAVDIEELVLMARSLCLDSPPAPGTLRSVQLEFSKTEEGISGKLSVQESMPMPQVTTSLDSKDSFAAAGDAVTPKKPSFLSPVTWTPPVTQTRTSSKRWVVFRGCVPRIYDSWFVIYCTWCYLHDHKSPRTTGKMLRHKSFITVASATSPTPISSWPRLHSMPIVRSTTESSHVTCSAHVVFVNTI